MAESGKNFQVAILTPAQKVFSGEAVSLTAPGELGYLGIWANHAPLLSTLKAGKITLRKQAGEELSFISPGAGFLEVFHNKVTLLLDAVV